MEKVDKTEVLKQIFHLHDELMSGRSFVCREGCATCCTRNVVLTTLEGRHIMEYLTTHGKLPLLDRIRDAMKEKRFIPRFTTNRLAAFTMEGIEPPEEELDDSGTPCPLLIENRCAIYPVRPFGCHCLVSKSPCRETGYAEIDPFVVTVNNVLLQIIEHLDGEGLSGNLIDVLPFLEDRGADSGNLVHNSPMPALMIPPDHRTAVAPILKKLRSIPL